MLPNYSTGRSPLHQQGLDEGRRPNGIAIYVAPDYRSAKQIAADNAAAADTTPSVCEYCQHTIPPGAKTWHWEFECGLIDR